MITGAIVLLRLGTSFLIVLVVIVLNGKVNDMPVKGYNELHGNEYGRLTVIDIIQNGRPGNWYLCECECGKLKEIRSHELVNGKTKSCGCLQKELMSKRQTTHGMRETVEYNAWVSMKQRCNNSKHKSYYNYGGRGINICDEWQNDFVAFYEYVGQRPSEDYSLDRIDNNGNYEPGNIKWSTKSEQAKNRRERKKDSLGRFMKGAI